MKYLSDRWKARYDYHLNRYAGNTERFQLQDSNCTKLEVIGFNSESNLGQTKNCDKRQKSFLEDFKNVDLTPSHLEFTYVIGDVYEFLIERFTSDAGKKAGEFYTPHQSLCFWQP